MQKIYYNYYGNRAVLYPRASICWKNLSAKGRQKTRSREHEKFLTLWKAADRDLPELTDAQSSL